MTSTPGGLKYSTSHEWVRLEGDVAVVGITDHAQAELGDIVYLELPDVGRRIAQDEAFGTVESVKAVSDLVSPVSGEVIEANTGIGDATDTVNQDPYGAGWLVRIRLSAPEEVEGLMTPEQYAAMVSEA
ncbi:MAG TPA: glycine cleavage system protein GcvH [Chthonomonadales bacterium]|nr:glycine cleavage system protein GcvH [Chthonomonadales bacterium]